MQTGYIWKTPQDNLKYMNGSEKFADLPPLQFTLREILAIIQNYRFWIGFAAVVIILTIAGPFGTLQSLNHAERLVYWSLHAVLTFFTGVFVAVFVISSLTKFGMKPQIAKALGAISVGFPVSIIVWCLNQYGFSLDMGGLPQYLRLLSYCLGISIAISLLYFLIKGDEEDENSKPHIQKETPFLSRLSAHLGKNLLHITSQDHYVEATTDRGSELILIRFSDAVMELQNFAGIQIHRSHWIADEAVEQVQRKNGNLFILTKEGKEFPVSRSNAKLVRERFKNY